MTAIFISHSSADNAAAAEMKAWLGAQGHTSLFLDFDPEAGIKGGSGWEQTLYRQLRQCQAVIALLTPSWLASKWCFAELVQARERGKAIFLVKVQPCEAGGVFSDIQHIDLTAEPEEGYRRLRIGLLERGLDPQDVFDWDPKRPPYPGLLAFQEADAAIFFGRGEEILKTLEALDALRRQGHEAARFALLLGASGSGKSSLARAGVIPRLKKKPAEWLPLPPFRPQQEPLDELAMALAVAFEAHGRPRAWSVIRAELHAAAGRNPVDGLALLNLARDLAIVVKQPEATLLLTIDQSEELFGYSPPEAATRFLCLLRAALEAADRRLMAMATLRSDFLGEFQNHPALQDGEYPHHFLYRDVLVAPMPLRNFPAIIQGPARLAGIQLDDGLVDAMVHDTGARDVLPLLAFTLRRLYERYGDDGRLTADEYESLGRLEGAVREAAQRVIMEADPAPEELEALHGAFVPTMVRINAEGGYARRRALFDDLPRRALPLLRRFVDARLLVTDRDPQNRETIEVAHEALLRTWPLLGSWLAEDQDKLRLLESIQRSAEEWGHGGRRDDLLVHRNGRLKDAEALLANPRFTLPEASVERAYLNACSAAQRAREAAEKKEQERRIRDAERIADEQKKAAEAERRSVRNTRIWLVVALLVAGAAVWQYFEARKQSQIALSRQLAAQSAKSLPDRLDVALLLGARASTVFPTVEAHQSLLQAVDFEPGLHRFLWGHTGTVTAAAFSPDGKTLASASSDKRVILWNVATSRPSRVLDAENWVTSITFSPDGTKLAAGVSTGGSGSVVVWDLMTARRVAPPAGHRLATQTVAFSPDGKTLASGGKDGAIILWNAETGEQKKRPLPSGPSVFALAFSPGGERLAAASGPNVALLWDLELEQFQSVGVPTSHKNPVWTVAFSPDGKTLASAGYDGEVALSDVETQTAITTLKGNDGEIKGLAFILDGTQLVSAGARGIAVWNLKDQKQITALRGQVAFLESFAIGPDGQTLASTSNQGVTIVWKLGRVPQLAILKGHSNTASSVAFSTDGRTLASGSWDSTVRLWDPSGESPATTLKGHEKAVWNVAFSPDGRILASASEDHTVIIWDMSTQQPRHVLRGHEAEVRALAFSPDGTRLATGDSDGQVIMSDPTRPEQATTLKGHTKSVRSLAFSPDGRTLASGSEDARIVLWNVTTGTPRPPLPWPDSGGVWSVAFSPDGKTLVAGGAGGTVRFWDARNAQPGAVWKVPRDIVLSLAFSRDGQTLAVGARYGYLALWDVEQGQPIGTLPGLQLDVTSLAYSPNGKRLASANDLDDVSLWDVDPRSWVTRACRIFLNRILLT